MMALRLGALIIFIGILVFKLLQPKRLLNEKIEILEMIFASILLFSFFVNWFSWDSIYGSVTSVKGYEITSQAKELYESSYVNRSGYKLRYYLSYFGYFIPIFSFATILLFAIKENKKANITARFASILPFILGVSLLTVVVYLETRITEFSILQHVEVGFYLMILSGVGLGTLAFYSSEIAHKFISFNSGSLGVSTINGVDKSTLLSQLEKLHSLQEKGVLTQEIYNQERQVILSQLQNYNTDENKV